MINLSMAEPDNLLRPRLSVVGVGGAGCNAINNMIRSNLEGCDFIAANTDAQALQQSLAGRKIQLGIALSRGLGAGSKPEIGRAAAEEQISEIMSILEGSDMLFVTAGMGGGTGTGAAPVIARAAREMGILTVGVVTKPFNFEGAQRMRKAEAGIIDLQQYVDTLIVIPNQNLFRIANERTTFAEAFRLADEVLNSGVRGITDLMVMPGFMNLDFADVKTVMGEMGKAMMGTGEGEGDNRALRAAEAAISNPLLDDISMKGARGVLVNVTGGLDMTLFEVDQAANRIREEVDSDAQIKVGSTLNESLEGRIRVSVIATGIDAEIEQQARLRATQNVHQTPAQSVVNRVTGTDATRRVATPVAKPAPTVKPVVTQQAQPSQSAIAPAAPSYARAQPIAPQPVVTQPVAPQHHNTQYLEPEPVDEYHHEDVQPVASGGQTVQRTTEPSSQAYAQPGAGPAQTYATSPAQRQTIPQSPLRHQPMANPAAHQSQPAPAQTSGPAHAPAPAHAPEPQPDMRITQLTAKPAASQPAANHRSQSLFQRITGFGMVRPSAIRDAEDALMDTMEAAQPRLSVDPSDRPALSSNEQSDLLDIPAFLRRQTNH